VGSWLEHLFALGHGAWWGRWELWQLAAVGTGAIVLLRTSGRHTVAPFGVGVLVAAAFAVLLGNAGAWATWAASRQGPAPELEIAGTGALLGLAFGFALMSGRRGLPPARALDELGPAIGPILAVARVGCFFAGCDFGAPTGAWWALRYPPGTAAFAAQRAQGLVEQSAAQTLPVHPAQLYEVAAGVALALAGAIPSRGPAGVRFVRVVVLFAALRACTDLARGDLARGSWGLTATQWLALAAFGAALAWRASRVPVTPP
jgi:Prolipoprotein diacylglyceryl transferase